MARLFVNIAAVLSLLSLITVAAGAGSTTTTTASSSSSSSSLSADEQCFCALTGQIDDCCCSIEDVERLNAHIQPLALRLAQSAFFKFYRVSMASLSLSLSCSLLGLSPPLSEAQLDFDSNFNWKIESRLSEPLLSLSLSLGCTSPFLYEKE